MVITRPSYVQQHRYNPAIKEAMTPSPNSRNMSPRVSELPSLRYGRVGANTTLSGPLRVAPTPEPKLHHIGRSITNPNLHEMTVTRPPRRVRFDLSSENSVTLKHSSYESLDNLNNNGNRHLTHATIYHQEIETTSTSATVTTTASSQSSSSGTSTHHQQHPLRSTNDETPTKNTWLLNQQRRISRFSVTPTNPATIASNNHPKSNSSNGGSSGSHTTGKYIRGTLTHTTTSSQNTSPTSRPTMGSTGQSLASRIGGKFNFSSSSSSKHENEKIQQGRLLQVAKDGDENELKEILKKGALTGIPESELNAVDSGGRTPISYIVSNGSIDLLESILQIPGIDYNKADNEGNTPLHFAAQAGQVECLNYLVSRCSDVEVDARNNLGFTPLMKAALQGRNKCAKLLLFAGASHTMRDLGRGLRAEQWARFCGRYQCAEVIEKFARHRLIDRNGTNGRWGSEPDIGSKIIPAKVSTTQTTPPISSTIVHHSNSIKSKIKKVFRSSNSHQNNNNIDSDSASSRLVSQLTTAALCASTPVLPTGACTTIPPVKSLIRPLTVPKVQVTLVNNNGDTITTSSSLFNNLNKSQTSLVEDIDVTSGPSNGTITSSKSVKVKKKK